MATVALDATGTLIDDYDAITQVVQLYIDGSAKGDAGKLREAFHPDARMFGAVGEHRYDVPIEELFKLTAAAPMDMNGRYRGRITSVNQVGDAAMATIAEDGCWGDVSFVDFFSMSRIDGVWKIVNKTFAHTGGAPPAG